MDPGLIEDSARRMFGIAPERTVAIRAATTLEGEEVRQELQAALGRGGAALVYLQDKLGGEISLSATSRSPEMSFDVTLVELVAFDAGPTLGRYAILEVQTMDFHGSYQHVVANLNDALRLHSSAVSHAGQQNTGWLSNKIEGPNIANVFKRTIYQVLLKFRLAGQGACAGATLAIPVAVWDSCQRHLGAPMLAPAADGTYRLATDPSVVDNHAWIYVFDLDADSTASPNPVRISKIIGTDADAIAHLAFKVAPEAVLAEGGSGSLLLDAIRTRLARRGGPNSGRCGEAADRGCRGADPNSARNFRSVGHRGGAPHFVRDLPAAGLTTTKPQLNSG